MQRKKDEIRNKWKKRLKERAETLFPSMEVGKDDADALLIANYKRIKDEEILSAEQNKS